MANIVTGGQPDVFQIKKFLGVNDAAENDTQLKLGEAAKMRNWRITKDGSLQIRPGTDTKLEFNGAVRGMWHGYVAGVERFVLAADSNIWLITQVLETWTKTSIGVTTNDAQAEFFGYSDKLYMINGHQYMVWDGNVSHAFSNVVGYIPRVAISRTPSGSESTSFEQINKLSAKRKVWFSSDGETTTYVLPEKDLASVDSVTNRTTGSPIGLSSIDLRNGTFTISTSVLVGVNNVEVVYTAQTDGRSKVCSMRFCETFNGTNDNRVFLYGDDTNQCIYSGIDYEGNPTAEYFPDLNVLNVGEENTEITSMVRHLSRLIAFKPSSTYSITYGNITQESGVVIPAFYVTPVNRSIGNIPLGQSKLVLNNPRSIMDKTIYSWRAGSSSGYLNSDERQAKQISDRITFAMTDMTMENAIVYDDEYNQEYYIVDPIIGKALVNNYEVDAWYIYEDFPVTCFARVGSELYVGTTTGKFRHFSRDYHGDDTTAIDAFWRSGSMAFQKDWKKKYTSNIFVAMLPETGARVLMTVRTNNKADYEDKIITYGLSTFVYCNFKQFSFGTSRQPQVKRIRMKAKKYTYLQLVFKSDSISNTATIVGTDIVVRYSGDVK